MESLLIKLTSTNCPNIASYCTKEFLPLSGKMRGIPTGLAFALKGGAKGSSWCDTTGAAGHATVQFSWGPARNGDGDGHES